MANLRFWDDVRDNNVDISNPNVLVNNYYRLTREVQAATAAFVHQYLAVHETTGTASALLLSQSSAGELRQKDRPVSMENVASGVTLRPHVDVAAGATLKVGSSPALPIYQTQLAALEAGVLKRGQVYHFRLDVNGSAAAIWVLEGYWPATELVKPDWDAASGTAAEILNKPAFGEATELGTIDLHDGASRIDFSGDIKQYSFLGAVLFEPTTNLNNLSNVYTTHLISAQLISAGNYRWWIRSINSGEGDHPAAIVRFNYTPTQCRIDDSAGGQPDGETITLYGIR